MLETYTVQSQSLKILTDGRTLGLFKVDCNKTNPDNIQTGGFQQGQFEEVGVGGQGQGGGHHEHFQGGALVEQDAWEDWA